MRIVVVELLNRGDRIEGFKKDSTKQGNNSS